jgi:hypothetical protein
VIDLQRNNGAWGALPFALLLIGAFDVIIGVGVREGVRSESFDTAPGVVTKSDTKPGHKGSVDFKLEYTYAVNGQQFTGTKYHIQPQFVGNGYWYAARDAHPVGTPVTVHFDPDDPDTAYLVPGLRADILFIIWFLTPFNLILVALVWVAIWHGFRRRSFDPRLRRCVRLTPDGWRVTPSPENGFWPIAGIALFAITFAGCFVALAYVMIFDFPPPWVLPGLMWAVAVAGAVRCGIHYSRRECIRVNELERTITFLTDGQRPTVAREQILGIEVTPETRKAKGGDYEVFAVSLRWRPDTGAENSTRLAAYGKRADADALAGWLRKHLEMAPAPVEPAVA